MAQQYVTVNELARSLQSDSRTVQLNLAKRGLEPDGQLVTENKVQDLYHADRVASLAEELRKIAKLK